MAFHPEYKVNRQFFVYYTRKSDGATIVSRFTTKGQVADLQSEQILFSADQPYTNHNGGGLIFGPDKKLYISLGDGGSGGDPQNHAQNLKSWLGKIIRIDVDQNSQQKLYSIPNGNLCELLGVSKPIACVPEIYAYGLRNTWRFSFDSATGKLWAGDVGQNLYEEIDIVEAGKNYAWRMYEGQHEFNCENCSSQNLEFPVFSYGRDLGASVTGGYVYRGTKNPSLKGRYIFGDFVSGRLMSLNSEPPYSYHQLADTNLNISTFATDSEREIYFLDYSAGGIYLIQE